MYLPTDQDSFMKLAFDSYDRKSCISSLEIYSDLRNIFRIKKILKNKEEGKEYNIRQLVNLFVVMFNQFGQQSIPLIFYKLEKNSYRTDCYFVFKFLNRWDPIWEQLVEVNTKSIIETNLTNL